MVLPMNVVITFLCDIILPTLATCVTRVVAVLFGDGV